MQVSKAFPLLNEIRMTPLSLEGQDFHHEACSAFRLGITAHPRFPQDERKAGLRDQSPCWKPGEVRIVSRLEGDIELVQ